MKNSTDSETTTAPVDLFGGDNDKLFAEARRELADRKAGVYGLGRSWMLIDRLFKELDKR